MKRSKIHWLETKDLHFDRANPRLAEYGIALDVSDSEIIKILWDEMDVLELVQSISASGFFPHESLIVAEEEGKRIVIEGNRRLAAVRVILESTLAEEHGWSLPPVSDDIRSQLLTLPAILASREDSWRYLGFKHVNGPAKWSSYAKAAYVAKIKREYGTSLVDIAHQIGDRHGTVQKIYRALMVLEQAEKEKVYDREDRFNRRLAFSHLYTGLEYDGIGSFLNLREKTDETDSPVPQSEIEKSGELLTWLYGSKKEKKPPVVKSQNPHLRQLNSVVSNRESLAALRADVDLEKAFQISQPPRYVFEQALIGAKRELATAQSYLTEGDDFSDELLKIAGTIANMSDDLYEEMTRKRNPSTKKQRISE